MFRPALSLNGGGPGEPLHCPLLFANRQLGVFHPVSLRRRHPRWLARPGLNEFLHHRIPHPALTTLSLEETG